MKHIQAFREHAGLTQDELGNRVGVTRQTIAAWERGERSPTVVQLARVAEALRVRLPLLLALPEDSSHVLFRSDDPAALSPEVKALAIQQATDYAELEQMTGTPPVLPESRPLDSFDLFTVEDAANRLRGWLGVEGTPPLGDVINLLEANGLKVIPSSLPAKVSGFSAHTEEWGGAIFVNANHPPERQYFTALHELGHLIFHRRGYNGAHVPAGPRDPREKVAQTFAGAVLLPPTAIERELRFYRGRWLPEPLLLDIKLRYGVSMQTVAFRAAEVRLITKEQAGKQVGVLRRKYGDTEPGEVCRPKGTHRLERLVYQALLLDKITTSRAAEVLGVPLIEIRRRLAEWTDEEPCDPAR
ncbi:MAG: ImmA/IrrE family metallo-endopeptidase [Chloroflexi bacterium]|nr:ImmA/IrrE family metallo-endopeptidase [Chloroflexota bacterium]